MKFQITSILLYSILLINGNPFQNFGSGLPQYVQPIKECSTNSIINKTNTDITLSGGKLIRIENILKSYKEMDFSLRGVIYFRTAEIEKDLGNGSTKPFKTITRAHIADSQAAGQKPVTFLRQMLALVSYPELMHIPDLMPKDAVIKAQGILQDCSSGSIGSYSSPKGLTIIREHVAGFISRRDGGIPSNLEDIYLTDGVTGGMLTIMKLLQTECNERNPGIMVPIPLYPLYSAVMTKDDIRQINYYLNGTNNWELEISELERAFSEAVCKCNCIPRAILIINPGNPTGKVLSRERMESVVKFAYSNNLVILADEIFQDNVYGHNAKFVSFKKVIMEMGEPYNTMELISFHSVSKGYLSESGLRGGYFEFVNSDSKLKALIFQLVSVLQCPNLLGQVALDCLVDPPKEGGQSSKLFEREKLSILQNLKDIAEKMVLELNKLDGINCFTIDGGIVAFPKITLPLKAIQAAENIGRKPDEFYGLELLESTGISVAVGSAFGLNGNKTYLRITIPPTFEKLDGLLKRLREFHADFMKKYSDYL